MRQEMKYAKKEQWLVEILQVNNKIEQKYME